MQHDDDEPEYDSARTSRGCQCFEAGEVRGTCPGPENCPMCEDDNEWPTVAELRRRLCRTS